MTDIADRSVPATGVTKRLLANPLGLASTIVLVIVAAVALLVPVLPIPAPSAGGLAEAMEGPSAQHWLGTDTTGRDILSRLLWGSRVNLAGALLAAGVALVLGVPAGIFAGYYRGWVDSVSGWVNDLIMALPGIIVLLAVSAIFGPSIWLAMIIFGIMLAPAYYRIVRASVLTVRGELYIDAAVVSGLSDTRILFRHVLAVVRAPVIIQGVRLMVIAIAIQAGLEFLGIGDPTVPSWGGMLNEGFRKIYESPELVLWPSIAIGIVSMSLVLFANALRDALEERSPLARRRRSPARERKLAAVSAVSTAAPTGDATLEVEGLKVAYDYQSGAIEVVHGVSLSIKPGEVLGLVGESGSGKSQTALAVLGLLPHGGVITEGSVRLEDRNLTGLAERQYARVRGSQVGYVPQEPMSNLDPTFTIGSQLTVPMRRTLGISRAEAHARAIELLERVGINDPEAVYRSYPFQLSGGMAQRVLIAGAVSCNPRLLIADEPTTALDVTVQAEVLGVLRKLQKETGMAVLMVTHNFGVVADICDRVAVMSEGLIVESGDVREVLRNPQHEYTISLLESMLEEQAFRTDSDVRAGA